MTDEAKKDALTVMGPMANLPTIELNIDDIKKYICVGATDKEFALFIGISQSYALNPFKREIYFVKYGNNAAQTIVGYEVYLKRAERTGRLDGWDVEIIDNGERAKITIHRSDWKNPFIWYVDRAEFDKNQSTWKAMPNFMLKKVAIAQGMRLAFPDELGGMPYIPEELPATMTGGASSESLSSKLIDVEATEETDDKPEVQSEPKPPVAKEAKKKTGTAKEKVEKAKKAAAERTAKKSDTLTAETTAGSVAGFEDPTGDKLTPDLIKKITDVYAKHDIPVELLVKWRGLKVDEWTTSVRKELLDLYKTVKSGDTDKSLLEEMTAEE